MIKSKKILLTFVFLPLSIFVSCKNDSESSSPEKAQNQTVQLDSTTRADKGGSGVMLQGFTWSSPNKNGDWYATISKNADEIKDTFEYVWYPPASDCTDTTGNGYLPRRLNLLTQKESSKVPYYGSEGDLKKSIQDIKPAKAIEDVVINHRCGTTGWGDFTEPSWDKNFSAICSDDEGFTNTNSNMFGARYKGAKDTGEGYSAGRDLDHTNINVQNGITTWMNTILKDAGFVGWRYDYVKGYAGNFTGYYNAKTEPEFSVGEYWPTGSFNGSSPETWSNAIYNWVETTAQYTNDIAGKPSRAFDFVLKGMFNEVFGCGNTNKTVENVPNKSYAKLANANNLYKRIPGYTVTFVDNHDTGSTQKHWYLDPADIASAYAFILTHPGYPSVAWYHYFSASDCPNDTASQYIGSETVPGTDVTYKTFIKTLIQKRKDFGISDMSEVEVINATDDNYTAEVTGENGKILLSLGGEFADMPTGYAPIYQGADFKIFEKNN